MSIKMYVSAIQIVTFNFQLLENCLKGRMSFFFFFTFCDLNETFIFMSKFSMEDCPQMKYKLVVQRKIGHILSYHVPSRQKFIITFIFDISKLKCQNGLKLQFFLAFFRPRGLWKHNPPKNCAGIFAKSESCGNFGTWFVRWSKSFGGVTIY